MKEVFGYWRWNWSFSLPYQIKVCKLYGSDEAALANGSKIHSFMRCGIKDSEDILLCASMYLKVTYHYGDVMMNVPCKAFANSIQFVLNPFALITFAQSVGLKFNWRNFSELKLLVFTYCATSRWWADCCYKIASMKPYKELCIKLIIVQFNCLKWLSFSPSLSRSCENC